MTAPEVSPRPWEFKTLTPRAGGHTLTSANEYGPTYHAIVAADGGVVCEDATYYNTAPDVNDMAFIAKACNAHDELVAALKMAKQQLAAEYSLTGGDCIGGVFVEINAALAKADA